MYLYSIIVGAKKSEKVCITPNVTFVTFTLQTPNDMKYTAQDIRKSKDEAIAKIEQYLSYEDVNGQFENINGDYYSDDKFIVTWKSNYKGMASEGGIHKVDPFYTAYSGYRAIWADVGLFHEKQHKGYSDIWRALIMVGAELVLPSKKSDWLKKYAPRYNEWIKTTPKQ